MIGPVRTAASSRPSDTERMLRYRGSALTLLRQIRAVARQIRFHDSFLTDEAKVSPGSPACHENTIAVLAVRLVHLIASLEDTGHTRPPVDDVTEILARHGLPDTLAGWNDDDTEVPDGESP